MHELSSMIFNDTHTRAHATRTHAHTHDLCICMCTHTHAHTGTYDHLYIAKHFPAMYRGNARPGSASGGPGRPADSMWLRGSRKELNALGRPHLCEQVRRVPGRLPRSRRRLHCFARSNGRTELVRRGRRPLRNSPSAAARCGLRTSLELHRCAPATRGRGGLSPRRVAELSPRRGCDIAHSCKRVVGGRGCLRVKSLPAVRLRRSSGVRPGRIP